MKKILHYIAIPIWLVLIPIGAAIGWLHWAVSGRSDARL
jgi:hypothetical protein